MRDELTKTPLLILSSFKPILQSVNNDNDKGKTTASSPSPQPVHLQAVNKATQSSLTDHLLPPHQCQDLFVSNYLRKVPQTARTMAAGRVSEMAKVRVVWKV